MIHMSYPYFLYSDKVFKTQGGLVTSFKFYSSKMNDLGLIKEIHSLWAKKFSEEKSWAFRKSLKEMKILLMVFKVFNLFPDIKMFFM